jgi:AcrR family transcriptional regulator
MDLDTQRMSREESRARTRQRLLESAHAVFSERGFAAATVEEIADRAGYTRGAFYANWPDKAELLWELVDASDVASFEELAATLEAAEIDERLGLLQSWFDERIEPRPLQQAFNELMQQASLTSEGRERQAVAFANERRVIVRIVEEIEGALGVDLPIPAEHFAAMALAAGSGLAMQHQADPDSVPSTLFGDAQAYLWLGVVAATESPDFTPRTKGR